MGLLTGKVVIITGAGAGLGRAHALLFARAGAKLVINDLGGARDGTSGGTAAADTVVAELKALGAEVVASYDSIADYAGAKNAMKTALDAFGRVDVLVNNAGILRDKTLLKMEEPMWDAVIQVHLKGTFIMSQLFAMHAVERGGGGRIVNTTSIAGLRGNYGQSNYAAAKAGIYALTRVHSMELAKHGVTVNAIAPVAKTRLTVDIDGVPEDWKAEHVSPMALFLSSDLSADLTGRIFGVHGLQIFEYRMDSCDGVTKSSGEWTAEEIADRIADIGRFGTGGGLPQRGEYAAPAGTAAAPLTTADKVKVAMPMLPKAFQADRAAGWNAVMHFKIEGAQDYTLTVKDGAASIAPGKGDGITCNVALAADTIVGMLDGSVKGEQAFMAGKIKADSLGDMMKFGKVFRLDPAEVKAAIAAAGPSAPAPAPAPAAAAAMTPADKVKVAMPLLPKAFQADRGAGWNAAIHFAIAGAQDYTLSVKDGAASIAPGKGEGITCNVALTADTIVGMLDGSVKGEQAFMAGKIKADNLGDMMKFGKVFRLDPAEVKAAIAAAQGAAPAAAPATTAAATAPMTPADKVKIAMPLLPRAFQPDRGAGWNAAIHFAIEDAQDYTLTVKDGTASIAPGKGDGITCNVALTADTIVGMLDGSVKGEQAFMAGKIKADNLGDMMKFGKVFRLDPAEVKAALAGAAGGAPAVPAPAAAPVDLTAILEGLPTVFQADEAKGWNGKIHLAAGGVGATVTIKDQTAFVKPGRDADVTATIEADAAALADWLLGKAEASVVKASNAAALIKFRQMFHLGPDLAPKPKAAPVGANRERIGHLYAGPATLVRPEWVRAYALATNDENPAYLDPARRIVAPPIFGVRVMRDLLFEALTDKELNLDLLRLVHGEQDMIFHAPIHPWDLLTPRARLLSIEDKESGQLVTMGVTLYREGRPTTEMRTAFFIRGDKKLDKGAPTPEPERPGPVFTHEMRVSDDQPLRYADASGDHNPIHTDPEVAKAAGHPGIILQGLCTMAFTSQAVIRGLAAGDPLKLRRLAVRFSRPVLPGDTLKTRIWAGDGPSSFTFETTNANDVKVITNGIAELL